MGHGTLVGDFHPALGGSGTGSSICAGDYHGHCRDGTVGAVSEKAGLETGPGQLAHPAVRPPVPWGCFDDRAADTPYRPPHGIFVRSSADPPFRGRGAPPPVYFQSGGGTRTRARF